MFQKKHCIIGRNNEKFHVFESVGLYDLILMKLSNG